MMSQRTRTALIVAVAFCLGVGLRSTRGLDLEPCTSDNDCNEGDPNQCQVCGEDGFCEQKDVTSCDDVCYTGPGAPCDENCPDDGGDDETYPGCPPGDGCGGADDLSAPPCSTCSTCDAARRPDGSGGAPGGGDGCNKGVFFRFTLGTRADGTSAGQLWIKESKPSPLLATPRMLRYGVVRGDIEVIRDESTNVLRQVKTPQTLADIEEVDDYTYTIKFYDRDNWGTKSGRYWVPDADDQFVTWVIKNPDESATVYNRLSIAKVLNYGQSNEIQKMEYLYTYDSENNGWTLVKSEGTTEVSEETITSTIDPVSHLRTDTRVRKVDDQTVYQAIEQYTRFRWGYELTYSEIGGSNPIILHRSYYDNVLDTGKYGKIRSWTNEDGSWEMRNYNSLGLVTLQLQSWRDAGMPSQVVDGTAHAIVYTYGSVDGRDNLSEDPKKPRTVTEKIGTVVVAKTYHAYFMDQGLKVHIEERCPNPSNTYGQKGEQDRYVNLRTISKFAKADEDKTPPDRIVSIEYPDGRMDEYDYADGDYTADQDPALLGTFDTECTGACDNVQITVEHGNRSSGGTLELVAYKSTKEVIIRDLAGNELQREVYAYLGNSGDQLFEYQTQVFDAQGRRTDRYGSDNTRSSWAPVDCCEAESFTDATGVKTEYEHDGLGRLKKETRTLVEASSDGDGSYAAQPAVETEYYYEVNAEDYYQVRKVVRATENQTTLSLQSETVYDDAGRVIKEVGQDRLPTTYGYAYVVSNGQVTEHTVTKTLPSPAGDQNKITEVTRFWRDGGVRSITGTGVVHSYINRGLDDSNRRYTKTYIGPSLYDSLMWQQTTQDAAGRTYQESRPGYNSSTPLTTSYHYNLAGQLERVESPGKEDTLYSYDELGNVRLVCQDVEDPDDENTIDLASADRITGTETIYEADSPYVWRKTISTVYGYSDDAQTTPSSTPKPVSQHWEARNLRGIAGNDNTIERTKDLDVDVNEVLTLTTVDRDNADRLVKRKRIHFDNGTDPYELAVSRNGLPQLSKSKSGLTTTYAHDALGRQIRVTDPRGNYMDTVYYEGDTTTDRNKGKVLYTQDEAGNRTTYAYDSDTGRVASITTADGANEEGVQRFSYNKRGQQERIWGDTPYPVEYGYDDFGRQTSMKTYRGGSGWAGTEWPDEEDRGTADVTTWVFDQYSGLLEEKQYADHNPTANPPVIRNIEYTYENDGRLKKRFWSRLDGSNRIETEYLYGTTTDSAISDLTKIDYKDATKDVEYTFNRLGKHKTVQDAVGTRTFAYDAAKLRLASEVIEAGANGLYTRTISRLYELATDTLPGRYKSFHIGTSTPYEYESTYAYDDSGRVERITGPGLDSTYGAVYARLFENSANTSDLVEYTYFKSSSNVTLATIHRKYDGTRDLVDFVENLVGSTTVSKYDYTNDTLGRRTAIALTGSAFTGGSGDHHWDYRSGYNDRSELIGGLRKTGTTLGAGSLMSPGDFDYVYDPIGNRTESNVDNADPAMTYTRNSVNQYTATSDPDESFTYDKDGNLETDGTFSYTWDAENRLIEAYTGDLDEPADGDQWVSFKYDYMGRRVFKWTQHWDDEEGENGDWVTDVLEQYVYDGWNVVLVLDDDGDSTRKYTWGLDLSGTIHDAGGIGGLLAVDETAAQGSPSYWFFYDANGNVGQVIKASDQSIAAKYEYDPYANIIGPDTDADGDWQEHATTFALANPIRFSTKWFDVETGLGYWGHRYYSPRLGRWINRDPIEEAGGLNLHEFVLNAPTVAVDALGKAGKWWPLCCFVDAAACYAHPCKDKCQRFLKGCGAKLLKCLAGGKNPCHAQGYCGVNWRLCQQFGQCGNWSIAKGDAFLKDCNSLTDPYVP